MTKTDRSGQRISADVKLGNGVTLSGHVNLYGCEIGDNTRLGSFVEIQSGAKVGARCKISSHTFICTGVTIEDEVFVGHGVMFTNDRWPRATASDGRVAAAGDWQCLPTLVQHGASIGSGCTILGGLTIGAKAMIGAGSMVTRDVPAGVTVTGNPARPVQSRPMTVGAASAYQPPPTPHAPADNMHPECSQPAAQTSDRSESELSIPSNKSMLASIP